MNTEHLSPVRDHGVPPKVWLIVLVRFAQDADPAAIADFIAFAEQAIHDGPFSARVIAPDLKLGIVNSADWGYVAEMDAAEDFARWSASAPHQEMIDRVRPIRDQVLNVQLPVPPGVTIASR